MPDGQYITKAQLDRESAACVCKAFTDVCIELKIHDRHRREVIANRLIDLFVCGLTAPAGLRDRVLLGSKISGIWRTDFRRPTRSAKRQICSSCRFINGQSTDSVPRRPAVWSAIFRFSVPVSTSLQCCVPRIYPSGPGPPLMRRTPIIP